jgi:DNA-binding LacI/PurR family transcriptional regulator
MRFGDGDVCCGQGTHRSGENLDRFVLRPHRYIEEDPFYSQVLMGVTQEAQRRRIHLAFVSGEYIEDETHSYEHYQILQHLAGIIIAGQMPKDFLDHIERIRIPCVFLNYRSSEYHSIR